MKKIYLILWGTMSILISNSQTTIKMSREGGVSIVPCKINGLSLSFIFDTGASDVSISLTEARFMFKNGYLNTKDITGTSKYSDATGGINEGVTLNLKEIEFAGLKLFNVKASIVNNLNAPLLLGQSAIKKLGKIQIDLSANTLTILNGNGNYDYSNKREEGEQAELTKAKMKSLAEINELLRLNKNIEAKNAIDDYMNVSANRENSEALFFAGRVYNAFSKELTNSIENVLIYKTISFEVFKRNQKLDTLDIRLKSESYVSYFDLYNGFFDLGSKAFNEMKYSLAYQSFSKALDVEDYVFLNDYSYNGFKFSKFDTSLILNIASSAFKNNDIKSGVLNYQKIIDQGITGENYESIYEYLVYYYKENQNEESFNQLLIKAKRAYPKNKKFRIKY